MRCCCLLCWLPNFNPVRVNTEAGVCKTGPPWCFPELFQLTLLPKSSLLPLPTFTLARQQDDSHDTQYNERNYDCCKDIYIHTCKVLEWRDKGSQRKEMVSTCPFITIHALASSEADCIFLQNEILVYTTTPEIVIMLIKGGPWFYSIQGKEWGEIKRRPRPPSV